MASRALVEFIRDQQSRLVEDRHGNQHPLRLSDAELARIAS